MYKTFLKALVIPIDGNLSHKTANTRPHAKPVSLEDHQYRV